MKKGMFNKKEKNNLSFSLLVNLLFLLFFLFVFYCEFETNDDYAMKLIVSGAYDGSPDHRVVFINSIIGFVLKTLYSFVPNVSWYEVWQITLIFGSLSTLTYILVCKKSSPKYYLLVLTTVYLCAHTFYTSLQFTKTASILAVAGYILLDDSINNNKKSGVVLSVFLIILGAMMRYDQFLVISLVGVSVFFPTVVKFIRDKENIENKQRIKTLVTTGIICLMLFALTMFIDRVCYSGYEWKFFNEYNHLRAKIQDLQDIDLKQVDLFYEKTGLNEADLKMLSVLWNNDDPSVFNVNTLMKLSNAAADVSKKSISRIANGFINDSVDFYLKQREVGFFTLIFIVSFSVCVHKTKDYREHFETVITIIVMLFCSTFCYWHRNHMYMFRTHLSILIAAVYILLYKAGNKTNQEKTNLLMKHLYIFMLIICIPLTIFWADDFRLVDSMRDKDLKKISAMMEIRSDSDHLYLKPTTENIDFVHGLFYDINSYGCANLDALGGWTTNMPLKNHKLSMFGVDNAFEDMIDNQHVYLIVNDQEKLQSILEYIQNHYNANARVIPVKNIEANKTYTAYRIVTE